MMTTDTDEAVHPASICSVILKYVIEPARAALPASIRPTGKFP